jgi:hypothetical protein
MAQTTLDYKTGIETYFRLVDKNERVVPFKLNTVQNKLNSALTGRDIVLKARQEGVSTLILALFTLDFLLMENTRSVCIAHDYDSTVKLFDRVKFFIKSFEEIAGKKVELSYNTRSEMINKGNNASFYVGTAGSKSFGRSATLTNVHFSELAYYPNPEEIYLSASQAGTPKRVIIESTANGVGDFFYKMWNNSVAHQTNYADHFYGWNAHDEYRAPPGTKVELTTEEEKLMERFNLTREQMAWRKAKMSEFTDESKFRQEYPLTPEEAFISSGNPVFNIDSLVWFKTQKGMIVNPEHEGNLVGVKPPAFEDNQNGYIRMFIKPKPRGQYVIGADTGEGKAGGDYSCAQVLDRKSLEQVAVFHGRLGPDLFARELFRLGTFYNNAMIAPENNSVGIAVCLELRDLYYPNIYIRERVGGYEDKLKAELGWRTDLKTKPIMVANTAKVIRDKQIFIHDEATLQELFSYQYDDSGAANATTGAHDDRVVALMIAIEMYYRTPIDDTMVGGNDIMSTEDSASDMTNFYSDQQNEGPPIGGFG